MTEQTSNYFSDLMAKLKNFFTPEKLISSKTGQSPSGKYELVISHFSSGKGWDVSKGEVVNSKTKKPIAEICRNYSSFPFLFIEDYNGHDYLICGIDYQGHTVIELDTGRREDLSNKDNAYGFCWGSYDFNSTHNILIVSGCYWAAPYEFRLYRFDTEKLRFFQIEFLDEDQYADGDIKDPQIHEDGTITFFQSPYCDDDNCDEDYGCVHTQKILSSRTFKIVNEKLELISEFISDEEKEKRRKHKENEIAYEKWKKEFKASDPLYLAFNQLIKDSSLSPDDYESMGWTYSGWCPDWNGSEQRLCKRVVNNKKPYTIDLEWGVKEGPIKIVVFKEGKHEYDKWFDHSADGMKKAFSYVKDLIK